ncbi:methylmalonyl-CoA mutase family protein [Brevundimonas abyssalis]|uniref:methylmalonyl-CoA mutase family protein n=1 Tax=Brevundimonas abyssalis TaxID=1125965 RepID=UPI000417A829|nr:methylmalonyl-CoA mutase family protein [Brevundimonas abyssalis]
MKSLSPDFPVPSLADWRALAEKGLKGAPFETLIGRTADGLAIQPLYAADPDRAVLRARPGLSGDRDRPWDLRTLIDHPEPARANALAHDALTKGAASLLLRLDPAGEAGVTVGSQDDLARALDGVLLDLAPVALDAGFMGAEGANWLAVLAKARPRPPSPSIWTPCPPSPVKRQRRPRRRPRQRRRPGRRPPRRGLSPRQPVPRLGPLRA